MQRQLTAFQGCGFMFLPINVQGRTIFENLFLTISGNNCKIFHNACGVNLFQAASMTFSTWITYLNLLYTKYAYVYHFFKAAMQWIFSCCYNEYFQFNNGSSDIMWKLNLMVTKPSDAIIMSSCIVSFSTVFCFKMELFNGKSNDTPHTVLPSVIQYTVTKEKKLFWLKQSPGWIWEEDMLK